MTGIYSQLHLFRECLKENKKDEEVRVLDTEDLINYKFEILSEEDKEIDIDSIEELDYCLEELEKPSYEESWLMNCIRANKDKLNELIKAVKQLNKTLKGTK